MLQGRGDWKNQQCRRNVTESASIWGISTSKPFHTFSVAVPLLMANEMIRNRINHFGKPNKNLNPFGDLPTVGGKSVACAKLIETLHVACHAPKSFIFGYGSMGMVVKGVMLIFVSICPLLVPCLVSDEVRNSIGTHARSHKAHGDEIN